MFIKYCVDPNILEYILENWCLCARWKRNLILGENCQKLFILARIEILDMNILDVKIIIYDLDIAYLEKRLIKG